MYEGYKLCDELNPYELCFVLEQYTGGYFERIQHRHVPTSRMSKDARITLLKALVVRFNAGTGFGFDQIVSAFLNQRSKEPAATNPFQIDVTYPEPGVLRTYCGTNTKSWCDEVILPSKFRPDVKRAARRAK